METRMNTNKHSEKDLFNNFLNHSKYLDLTLAILVNGNSKSDKMYFNGSYISRKWMKTDAKSS